MGRHAAPDPVEVQLLALLRDRRARGHRVTVQDLLGDIAQLEPRQAEAMRLVYVEQLRPVEAARRMTISPAAMTKLLKRGRINLLAALTL